MKAHEPDPDFWRRAFALTSIGWTMATAIAIGTLAGSWVDHHWRLGGKATIAGLAIGVALAFAGLVRAMRGCA
jgi:hypothetical protein